MKAVVCHELGSADRLRLEDIPDPEPGPGEVLIEVRAAALNFPDTLIIEGKYQFRPDLPFVPGAEASGVVAAVGDDVDGVAVGDRVAAVGLAGAFAERWRVPATSLIPVPDGLSFEEAAAFGLTYGTSYYALKQRAGLQAGETLLVLGAAGGVGAAAVEIGAALGARVIAAASTDEKLAFTRELGAAKTINYANEDLRARLKEVAPDGADVVYDPVGGDLSEPALRSTAWGGRFLVIGFAAGDIPSIPLNLALLKGASIVGVFWGNWAQRDPAASQRNFAELADRIAAGELRPRVSRAYPAEEYGAAFAELTGRRAIGKVVMTF